MPARTKRPDTPTGVGLLLAVVPALIMLAAAQPVAAGVLVLYEQQILAGEPDCFYFGSAVAMDATTAAIGCGHAVYLFERTAQDGEWRGELKLEPEVPVPSFGSSLDFAGTLLAVGADGENQDNKRNAGAAYIFERERGAWRQAARLQPADLAEQDTFGDAIAASGEAVAVAASSADVLAGAVYVFERDHGGPGAWGLVAKAVPHDADDGWQAGNAVDMDGTTLVVGAPGGDAAYVFERLAATGEWRETFKLTASDDGLYDLFGTDVSIAGERIVVSAIRHDPMAQVYVFERSAPEDLWREVARLKVDTHLNLGVDLALGSNSLLAGVTGAAYLFTRDPGPDHRWQPVAKLCSSVLACGAPYFGHNLAMSGGSVVVGSWDEFFFRGRAYTYDEEQCELRIGVEPAEVRPGDDVRVTLDLRHRRFESVEVPLTVWIEDQAGVVVTGRLAPPTIFRFGDRRRALFDLTLPLEIAPGRYRVRAGVEQMQQGLAWAEEELSVTDPKASAGRDRP